MVEYRPLGNTGLGVSRLSIGGSTLGNEYGDIEAERAIEAVRYAIDCGLNYLDTSPMYGDTLSETRLGVALDDGYRDRIALATKAGRYGKDPQAGFDYSYDRILRSWEESSRRLRTDYFDVFQLHDVEYVHRERIVDQAWPAMVRLKDEEKVGHIGISGYPLRYLAQLAVELEPPPETILTYCHYNLLNTSFDEILLPTARELGIGVINASVTHMGVLTDRGAPAWHPAPAEVHMAGRAIRDHLGPSGLRVTDVALRFAVAHSYVATTCVGMRSIDEVEQNLGALDGELDAQLLVEIEELIGPVMNLNWAQGLPEYNDPGSIAGRSSSP